MTAGGPSEVSIDTRLEVYVRELAERYPGFRIIDKEGDGLSRCIDLVLKVLTLGAQRAYMTRYHTVLWNRLYVPPPWHRAQAVDKLITLRHEQVHLAQRRRLGDFGITFLYVFWVFPLGLAYGRARIEWEAYTETLRATWELKGEAAARSPALKEHILRQFTSGAYGWMWPFPNTLERWYAQAMNTIAAEQGASLRKPDVDVTVRNV